MRKPLSQIALLIISGLIVFGCLAWSCQASVGQEGEVWTDVSAEPKPEIWAEYEPPEAPKLKQPIEETPAQDVEEGEFWFIKEGIELEEEEGVSESKEVPPAEETKALTIEEKLERKAELSFTNASLTTVLAGISEIYDVNILVDKDVTGTVTVNLKDVPLKNGLDSILKANNYSYLIEEDILKVVAYEELGVTEILQLNFVSPDVAYDFVEKFVSEEGDLKINDALNCLIMTDQSKNIERARKLIEKIDLAPRQVLIEAKLIDITYTDLSNLGIEWTSNIKFGSAITQDRIDNFDLSLPGPSASLSADQFTLGAVIKDLDLNITLEALIQNQKAKVLASPSLIAINNVEARINIGEKVPIREETQTTTGTTETTRFIDVGITLRVTPRITGNEYVQLVIHPEVSSVSAIIDAGPRITTRELDTTVLVRNRQTIVLAGLLQEEEDHTKGRVPILGSIPFLGWLFKNRSTDTYQKELVIFMTPYILPSPQQIQLAERSLKKKSMVEEMSERTSFIELYNRAQRLESSQNIESYNKDYVSRMKEAARIYEDILSVYPDDPRATQIQYRLADLYYSKLKDYSQAKRAFQELLEEYPDSDYRRIANRALKNIEKRERRKALRKEVGPKRPERIRRGWDI